MQYMNITYTLQSFTHKDGRVAILKDITLLKSHLYLKIWGQSHPNANPRHFMVGQETAPR